jgi:type IV secretory pathway VirJ component
VISALAALALAAAALAAPRGPAPAGAPDVSDLPLVEVAAGGPGDRLAILLSGDGGWAGLDRAVARALAAQGVAVVGLDSLRYFWRRRSPGETTGDVARIAAHYLARWQRRELLLVGYSRGADVVPFIAGGLPPAQRSALRLVAMLAPGTFAEFEVHALDLLASIRRRRAMSTEAAVRATGGLVPFLCVQGADEEDSLCPHLAALPWVTRRVLPGGHHFDRDYAGLARLILEAAPPTGR